MDAQAVSAAREACTALSIAYARGVDFRDYDLVADCFAKDGVLATGRELAGRENIRVGMQRRPDTLRSRHVLTNIFIDVESAARATGISYLTLYRHIGEESLTDDPIEFAGPAGVGHYADEFVCTDDGWRIATRRLYFAFRRRDAFPAP